MGKCIHHPDRETRYLCMKHQIYLCEECLQCKDPKIYCKHRSACPIWFMSKRQAGWDAEEKQEDCKRIQPVCSPPVNETASNSFPEKP